MIGAPGITTGTVLSENWISSMLRNVSTPSLTFWSAVLAPVWVTVTLAGTVLVAGMAAIA